jgi:hypothetical protein
MVELTAETKRDTQPPPPTAAKQWMDSEIPAALANGRGTVQCGISLLERMGENDHANYHHH